MDKDPWMQWFNSSNSGEDASPPNVNFRPPITNFQNPNFSHNFPTQFPIFPEGSNTLPNPYPPQFPYMYPPQYPYMPHPQYGFRPAMGTNSSRRPNTDGSDTDKDIPTPNSQRSSPFSSQFSPIGLEQINLASDFDAADDPPTDTAPQKKTYSDAENAHLASCWLDISEDPIVGNDQKGEQMWVRIAEAYNKNRPNKTITRHHTVLKTHYYTLQKHVKWFCGCFNQEKKVWGSGCSDADIIEKAKVQYKVKYGGDFKDVSSWYVLRDHPKFVNVEDDVRGSKKTKISASGEYVVSSNTDTSAGEEARPERSRPMGRNAARRMAKGKGKATTSNAGENVDAIDERLRVIEERNKKKLDAVLSLTAAQESIATAKEYKILMRDTSNMTDEQLAVHLHLVEKIKKKWGM